MSQPRKKAKKELIHFKGLQDLVDTNVENSAKKLYKIMDPATAKEVVLKLIMKYVNDFLKFSEYNYFQKEGEYTLNEDGSLIVLWKLRNKIKVYILFKGKGKVTVVVLAKNSDVRDYTNLNSILDVFARDKVPTR